MAHRLVIFGWAESIHIQRWVKALAGRGFQIRLISLGGEPIEGIETICLPRRGAFSYFRHADRAVRLAREFDPDLVHVHYAGGFGFWGVRCDIRPLVVSVWGSDVVERPANPIYRSLIRRSLRQADRVTATSHFLELVACDLEPRVTGRLTVVPFGVDPVETVGPMPDGPVRLCYIKGHRKRYGPQLLLRAMARAVDSVPDLNLTVAGAGPATPLLRSLSRRLGLGDRVAFPGVIPHERIYRFLQEHHIMVMPSLREAFGVAVLEASACGRPVIASRVGGVPEVLKDGETGVLVPPRDVEALARAIVELARDRERCRAMGEAGRRFVAENYRWEHSVDKMVSLYEELIDGGRAHPSV